MFDITSSAQETNQPTPAEGKGLQWLAGPLAMPMAAIGVTAERGSEKDGENCLDGRGEGEKRA